MEVLCESLDANQMQDDRHFIFPVSAMTQSINCEVGFLSLIFHFL